MSEQQADRAIELTSLHGFDTTVERLIAAIDGAGMRLFARIDHSLNATRSGLTMLPSTVLIYGSAIGGTPIMRAAPQLALDLPLRVLVRQDIEGQTLLVFHPVGPMLRAAHVPEDLASRLDPAQRLLAEAIQP